MLSTADLLWHINNEYRKRLGKVENYLDLLENLILSRDQQHMILDLLQQARARLDLLDGELREWRHHFYYEPSGSKRMVQGERDIAHALSQFSRMRSRHERSLQEIGAALGNAPRPDTQLTLVAVGDLWLLLDEAFGDLANFIDAPDQISQ